MADPEYFTLAEFQALPDCAQFDEDKVLPAAAFFVTIVEREVGRSFVPRTYVDTLSGTGCGQLMLSRAFVRSLTSVTVDGASVTVGLLTASGGVLRYLAGGTVWPATGPSNVVVTYSAGEYDECPADIKDAVMWATRDRLISQDETSGSWDRKTSTTNEFGTIQYALPGEKRPTGYPELDAVIASYVRNTASLGFA